MGGFDFGCNRDIKIILYNQKCKFLKFLLYHLPLKLIWAPKTFFEIMQCEKAQMGEGAGAGNESDKSLLHPHGLHRAVYAKCYF